MRAFPIMGWSDGANIGTIMAALQPERVQRLVVFGGQSFLTSEDIATFKAIRRDRGLGAQARPALRAIYGAELDGLWDRYVAGRRCCSMRAGTCNGLLLGKVRCPVLVLHGAKDPLVPEFQARPLPAAYPIPSCASFPHGRHNIHMRQAEEFNLLTHAFLTEKELMGPSKPALRV
jgi:valacyclovir hydrolase